MRTMSYNLPQLRALVAAVTAPGGLYHGVWQGGERQALELSFPLSHTVNHEYRCRHQGSSKPDVHSNLSGC